MLYRVSALWAKLELRCAALLAAAITFLILLNVVTRSARMAIYWIDEAAIYAMIWMAFLAASASIHHRDAIAVTIVRDTLSGPAERLLGRLIDVALFVFALCMVWFCWRWFDPLTLARVGFDTEAFQGETFNFIYAEPTNTLGLPKVWIWSIMPIFSFGALLHATANLIGPAQSSDRSPGAVS